MVIFNSYVSSPEGNCLPGHLHNLWYPMDIQQFANWNMANCGWGRYVATHHNVGNPGRHKPTITGDGSEKP